MINKPSCLDCGRGLKDYRSKRCKSCNALGNGNLIHHGKDNVNWKGEEAGYVSKHTWVYNHFGKPDTCEYCGRNNLKGKFINWANKSGKYLRKRDDWLRLCRKCHTSYDNIINRGWETKRRFLF